MITQQVYVECFCELEMDDEVCGIPVLYGVDADGNGGTDARIFK